MYEQEKKAHQLLTIEKQVAKMTRASSLDSMKQSTSSFYSRLVNRMIENKEHDYNNVQDLHIAPTSDFTYN